MTNTFPRPTAIPQEGRHPLTAAVLSLLPGLGQLYVGEKRKGILFLDVTAANAFLLWLMLFTEPMLKTIREMGQTFHFHPNTVLLNSVRQAHLGSPASLLLLAMMIGFVLYAARDAYDKAFGARRKKIYPEYVIDFSEATSGSYVAHIAITLSCAILALFFVMPKQDTQITSITVLDLQRFEKPQTIKKPNAAAEHNNAEHGQKTLVRPTSSKTASDIHSTSASTNAAAAKPISHASAQSSAGSSGGSSPKTSPSRSAAKVQATQPAQNHVPTPPAPARTASNPNPAASANEFKPLPTPTRTTAANPNPAPNPAAAPQHSVTQITTASPQMPPSKQSLAFNVPLPALPIVANNPNLAGLIAFAPRGMSTPGGHSALPVPALSGAAGRTGLTGGLPGGPTGISSSHSGIGLPQPLKGTGMGTGGLVPGGPAPMSVNTGGTTGGTTSGVPGLAPVRGGSSRGNSEGNSDGPGGHAPRPSKVGPGFGGNDLISIMPNVGNGPADSGGTSGTDRNVDDKAPSIATVECNFGPYMAELQRRIKRHWFPPHGPASKRVIVSFTVARDGTLGELKIARSAGAALEDNAATKAVEDAAPLPHLPAGAPESVQIEFTFDYNVMSGNGGSWHRAF